MMDPVTGLPVRRQPTGVRTAPRNPDGTTGKTGAGTSTVK